MSSGRGTAVSGKDVIRKVLVAAGARPSITDPVGEKNKYAVAFADHAAKQIAEDLAPFLRGIQATTKRTAGSVHGQKQLDVNFSTPHHGLALGVSLKSVHLGDVKNRRYTHNMKRNEEELRIEASGYHKRQPYAVMVGVLFLPYDSCQDGRRDNPSSFGSWVRHLRPYCGRLGPEDEIDRFEKLYVALYDPNGNDLQFFDVESDPPKNRRPPSDGERLGSDGRPRRLLTYAEFLAAVYHQYLHRNSATFSWADGEEEPIDIDEPDEGDTDPEEED